MKKTGFVHTAIVGGVAFAVLPAFAQDDPTGLRMVFGLSQEFEAGDNLSLENPEEGTTALSSTSLSFDLFSETGTQTLQFGVGGKLRAGEIPSGSDIDTGFVEPQLTFGYSREAANAVFSANANYRESDVAFDLPLSSFTDPDTGVIILPPDFEDLRGSGTRRSYGASTSLSIGEDAPLGFIFDTSVSGIDYSGASAATLNDIFRYSFGVTTLVQLSPVTTGFVGLNLSHYDSDDLTNTERDTYGAEVGITRSISERAMIEAAVGYTEVEETLGGVKTTSDGATGRFSYNLEMPNGSVGTTFQMTRDQDGSRQILRFTREMQLPRGGLTYNIGATRKGSGTPRLIGGINWSRELPTGQIKLGVNRNVTINVEDEERITTVVDFGYNHEINSLSSLGLDMAFGLSEDSASFNDTSRADVSASYNYALTPDWTLTTGVSYRIRDEDTVGKSDSTSVFLRIGREFTVFR